MTSTTITACVTVMVVICALALVSSTNALNVDVKRDGRYDLPRDERFYFPASCDGSDREVSTYLYLYLTSKLTLR
jgi:hypothetical protein